MEGKYIHICHTSANTVIFRSNETVSCLCRPLCDSSCYLLAARLPEWERGVGARRVPGCQAECSTRAPSQAPLATCCPGSTRPPQALRRGGGRQGWGGGGVCVFLGKKGEGRGGGKQRKLGVLDSFRFYPTLLWSHCKIQRIFVKIFTFFVYTEC